jgi:DNA-binding MarR family transcriptional regulator/GNAT superfamily N-acetyltransferase
MQCLYHFATGVLNSAALMHYGCPPPRAKLVDSVNYSAHHGETNCMPASPPFRVSSQVDAVRRFNRFYTRKLGLLQDGLYESRFSLTQVRVLYELASRQRPTARDLCNDLGLDPGYLSRMLRGFEKGGILSRQSSSRDARQQHLSLTARGRKVFAPLNRRSADEVARMLEPLSPAQQSRLVEATQSIEGLLGPKSDANATYTLRAHRPGDMGWITHRHGVVYWKEYGYDERFEALVAGVVSDFIEHFDPKREHCWIAERDREIVGSVFLCKKSKTVAKLRLLLVEPSARGLGIGKRLVTECVNFARKAGYRKMMLWTQSELLAARGIYQHAGFHLAGSERHDSWGRKGLVSEVWEMKL